VLCVYFEFLLLIVIKADDVVNGLEEVILNEERTSEEEKMKIIEGW